MSTSYVFMKLSFARPSAFNIIILFYNKIKKDVMWQINSWVQ